MNLLTHFSFLTLGGFAMIGAGIVALFSIKVIFRDKNDFERNVVMFGAVMGAGLLLLILGGIF